MIYGLQVTIGGAELKRRLVERVAACENRLCALDARIAAREGDQDDDVRADGPDFRSFGELKGERSHYAGRLTTLQLLRDSVIPDERYVLGRSDLQLAELMPVDGIDSGDIPTTIATAEPKPAVVEGLKLTLTGEQLRRRLAERIEHHEQRVERWERERERTREQRTDQKPLFPDHLCERLAEEHRSRLALLTFIRDHVEPSAVYRLGEDDLAFGELLPPEPGMEHEDDDEQGSRVPVGATG